MSSDFTQWGKTVVAMITGLVNAGMSREEAIRVTLLTLSIMAPPSKDKTSDKNKKLIDEAVRKLLGEDFDSAPPPVKAGRACKHGVPFTNVCSKCCTE